MVNEEPLNRIVSVLGSSAVVTDPEVLQRHAIDWTGRWVGDPLAVIYPRTPQQIAETLSILAEAKIPVVPQGGNTGLVGGGIAATGQVVLSTESLDWIGEVDKELRQITVGAGTTLEAVDEAVAPSGLRLGIRLASRSVATVGGAIATDAGGTNVVSSGHMRDQVVGIQAVLTSGNIIDRLDAHKKDNSGIRWERILCGSEGTLAVISAATIRLVPAVSESTVALVAFQCIEDAFDAATSLGHHSGVEAVELMLDDGFRLTRENCNLARVFDSEHDCYLLVEMSGNESTSRLADILSHFNVMDAAVAEDSTTKRALWDYRERHTEAISMEGVAAKCDVAVPPSSFVRFLDDVQALLVSEGAKGIIFGHVADASVHVNILAPIDRLNLLEDKVLQLAADTNGSISAEHGIGRMRNNLWHLARSESERGLHHRIRLAFDEHLILNPDVMKVS